MMHRSRRARSLAAVVVTVAATLATMSATAVATGTEVDFPAYMHDAGHSAYSPDATAITPTTKLKLAWTLTTPKEDGLPPAGFFATPIVVDHVVYVGSNSGDFYAVDEATGTVLWKVFLGYEPKATCGYARGFNATAASGIDPTTGELAIYAASGDGYVYALNAADGTTLWKTPVNVPTPGVNDFYAWSSPEIANGKIYVGVSSFCDEPFVRGGIVALDQTTGVRVARYFSAKNGELGASVWASPAVAPDGSVVIGTGNADGGATIPNSLSIERLDGNTLKRLDHWQLKTHGDFDFGAAPTIFEATLGGVSTPMVGDCNKNGWYYAFRLDDLKAGPVWKYHVARTGLAEASGVCLAGAIWDGSALYVVGTKTTIGETDYRGSIRKLDPATGTPIWETGLPSGVMTSPTADGAGAIAMQSFETYEGVPNSAFLVDAQTGSFVVLKNGNKRSASSPVFADDYLILATGRGKIMAYEAQPPAS